MKRQAPTEREIADLIASAFDRLPAPDPRRLAAIEHRLLERSRRRVGSAWWWLAGALVAGAATAMWWGVNYDSVELQKQPVPAVTSPSMTPREADQPVRRGKSESGESAAAGEPAQKKNPMIYQRER